MPVNDLSPAFTKVHYTVAGMTHVLTFQVKNAQPDVEDNYTIELRDGTTEYWGDAIIGFMDFYAELFNQESVLNRAELWVKPSPSADPYVVEEKVLAINGLRTQAVVLAGQFVMSYRSQGGSAGKIYAMETIYTPNQIIQAPFTGDTVLTGLRSYLVSPSCMLFHRDDTQVLGATKVLTKTNDKLRKKRNLV